MNRKKSLTSDSLPKDNKKPKTEDCIDEECDCSSEKTCQFSPGGEHQVPTSDWHVVEHLDDFQIPRQGEAPSQHRLDHWTLCVFQGLSKNLARHCARGETRDVLSSVRLTVAEKHPGTTLTYAELMKKQNRDEQEEEEFYFGAQRYPDEEFDPEQLLLETDLCGYDNLPSDGDLRLLYNKVPAYAKEAVKRYKAVLEVINNLPRHLRDHADEEPSMKLMMKSLKDLYGDPREEVVKKVALYHWRLRNDFQNLNPLPMI